MTDANDVDSPYVGLIPFDFAHADYFFGRTLDAAVLADNVLARQVIVCYGASGVGKSSLLNVGLRKALAELGIATRIVIYREWHEPSAVFESIEHEATKNAGTSSPQIIVLDQFEEYFLYASPEDVKRSAKALASILESPGQDIHLLFSLRDDGLHLLDALRLHLPGLFDTTLELRHLDERSVREAITGPIEVWNERHEPHVVIDEDFADELIAQMLPKGRAGANVAGGRIELAYLQLALERIWEAEGGVKATALRTDTFKTKLKGVSEISRRHVELVLAEFKTEEDRKLCATIFDRLVTPSGGKILYSAENLALVANVSEHRMNTVLHSLASGRNRLLRSVGSAGSGESLGYEILHDILARPILDWKARYEAARRADERHANRTRLLIVSLGMTAVLTLATTVSVMTTVKTQEKATSALAANALWSSLEFSESDVTPSELNALWIAAMHDQPIRRALARELLSKEALLAKFGRQPDLVARSLGLRWPSPAEAQELHTAVLLMFKAATKPEQFVESARALRFAGVALDEGEQDQLVEPLLKAISVSPGVDSIPAFLKAAAILSLSQDKADRVLGAVVSKLTQPPTGEPDAGLSPRTASPVPRRSDMRQDMRALIDRTSPGTAKEILERMVAAIESEDGRAIIVLRTQALEGLPPELKSEMASQALKGLLGELVDGRPQSRGAAGEVDARSRGPDMWRVRALTPRVPERHADEVFNLLLNAASNRSSARVRADLLQTALSLPVRLDSAKAATIFAAAQKAIGSTTNALVLDSLRVTIEKVAVQLDVEHASRNFDSTVAHMVQAVDSDQLASDQLAALASVLDVLASKVGTQRSDEASRVLQSADVPLPPGLVPVLSPGRVLELVTLMLRRSPLEPEGMPWPVLGSVSSEFTLAMPALVGRIPSDHVSTTMMALTRWAVAEEDFDRAINLAQSVSVLAKRLPPDQLAAAVPELLSIVQNRRMPSQSFAAWGAAAIAGSLGSLGVPLTPAQGQIALEPLLRVSSLSQLDAGAMGVLASGWAALAAYATTEQVQMAVDTFLKALPQASSAKVFDDQAEVLIKLAPRLSEARQSALYDTVQARLSLAVSSRGAEAWARLLTSLLHHLAPDLYLQRMVDVLKYPSSAGPATTALLKGLGARFPEETGLGRGLPHAVEWLDQRVGQEIVSRAPTRPQKPL